MTTRPASFLEWVPDADPAKITQPPVPLSDQGYIKNQVPTFQHFNWLMHTADQWIQYLDQQAGGIITTYTAPPYLPNNIRLTGGGFWLAAEVTNTVTPTVVVSWETAFSIHMPGVPDSANQVAAGNVSLLERQIAWVDVNLPIITTGDVTSGSAIITNVADTSNIAVGMAVAGPGIPRPAGRTVSSKTSSTVTLSGNANLTASGAQFSFAAPTALTVNVGDYADFQPKRNSVIFATRREADVGVIGFANSNGVPQIAPVVVVGANCEQMLLRPCEWRTLDSPGYETVFLAQTAGTVTKGAAVQISTWSIGSTGPTATAVGNLSATNAAMLGFMTQLISATFSVAASYIGWVMCRGILKNVKTGLTAKGQYYLDTGGAITTTPPTASGSVVIPVGIALTSTVLMVNPAGIVLVNP